MGINYQTLKFKEELANLINNSGLPTVNVSLVLELTRAELSVLLNQAIEEEKKDETKE